MNALALKEDQTKRIVFHEITKSAITEAINNPRKIDKNLVDAQQARRVLDRLVGFELSPLLWRKIKSSLSAGRVQSVAVRLIVEREDEIKAFCSTSTYRIQADFTIDNDEKRKKITAELNKRFGEKQAAIAFLEKCKSSIFKIEDIETKPAKKSPAPPFTTSTLQQEASRKLGFSVANTMRVAQQLYESGKITYMRTDSVNLSKMALSMAKEMITESYGPDYVKTRQYTTKSKGAQEAHEAIRPSYLNKRSIEGDNSQKKLYDLIWKRTIASQMSDALLEKTNVTIGISRADEKFIARGEVIKFDGFWKVYMESTDEDDNESEEGLLPPLMAGEELTLQEMTAQQKFTLQPPRYTEASLVKKLEELGIGRPSTYAPTISTIQNRGYVIKEDRPGFTRKFNLILLKNNSLTEEEKTENFGFEKAKLFPTDIGTVVNNFLVQHFENILDYNFTAYIEEEFDEIAEGKLVWNKMIRDFYDPFHKQIEKTLEQSKKVSGEKLLGPDPQSGENVYVKIGRYGPMAQIGEGDGTNKPRFAGLKKGQSIETMTLEEAMELFKLPRHLGLFETFEVIVSTGRFGPFVKHKSAFYSLKKEDDPLEITLDQAIDLIHEKRKKEKEKLIKSFAEDDKLKILNGRFGVYISYDRQNYKIPKGTDPKELTFEECRKIISETKPSVSRKTRMKK